MVSATITRRPDPRPEIRAHADSMRSNMKLKGSGAVGTLAADTAGGADWSQDPARAGSGELERRRTVAKTRETSTGVTVIHQRVRQ